MRQLTRATVGLMTLLLTSTWGLAAEAPLLKDDTDRTSYSVGYQVGGDFKRQGMTLSREALIKGIEDALADNSTPLMSPQEMRTTLIDLKKRVVAQQSRQKEATVEQYRGEGREFLAANAKKEGVITLPSGLQYKVLTEGSGRQPAPEDTVTVNYRGTLIDGSEFDSSFRDGKPVTIPLNSVIAGWKEAIPLMKEGAQWQLFIPADLAFGERGPLADRTVIYELELLSVQPAEAAEKLPPPAPKPAM
ncbi:MAG: FKBP-type peptidyl-prolyl cis-trans isomerase [Desulfuromonadales bacterium]|nr:FKBP-type peptidyl-prolyl cis-trans isomerase [Desulfuromonadales bacterium]